MCVLDGLASSSPCRAPIAGTTTTSDMRTTLLFLISALLFTRCGCVLVVAVPTHRSRRSRRLTMLTSQPAGSNTSPIHVSTARCALPRSVFSI